jgi:hypothetical protein
MILMEIVNQIVSAENHHQAMLLAARLWLRFGADAAWAA